MLLPEKFYVQYVPDGAARRQLVSWQQQLETVVDSGRLVPIEELHVTVLHFGFLETTYQQLVALKSELSQKKYNDEVSTFINTVMPRLPLQCELAVERLAYFGQKNNVLVLVLRADEALLQAYVQTMAALQAFAKDLGIENIAAVASAPRALQVPKSLQPHLSLLKSVHADDVPKIFVLDTTQTLKFSLFQN